MNFTIHIKDVVIFRFERQVLGPYSCTINSSTNYILAGKNGVGKTSLLKALKGSLPIRTGSIRFEFHSDEIESIYDWKRQYVAFVSFDDSNREFLNTERYYQQRFHAFDSDDFSVAEYLQQDGYDPDNPAHQAIIDKCGISSLLTVDRIKLSSGQTRKYMIARALLKQPKLLLLDNPYVGLDATHRRSLNALIDELSASGDIQFILAGQYTDLPNSVTEILSLDDEGQRDTEISVPDSLTSYFSKTSHWPQFQNTLELSGVNIGYKDKTILKELDMCVKRGEKWAVIGDNGSGKSTLIGLIAADHPQAYTNKVRLLDKPRSRRDSIWNLKKHVGFSSSELHAYFHDPEMTCGSIVKQGLFETIYNRKKITQQQDEAIQALFQFFEIKELFNRRFQHCSTGEQRLILFCRAIIKNPPLLLLDEPFQCLDPLQVSRAKYLLEMSLTSEHSLIFISHFPEEIPITISNSLMLDYDESSDL